ncbi:MAG: carboxylesterase, type [Gemmatimonadetes bacterium]|nr:carboxylesterase, type [Gemmatimonadota bacterium]
MIAETIPIDRLGNPEHLRAISTLSLASLSKTVMSYWANCAITGDPNGAGLPRWPAFTPAQPTVLRLGERIEPRAPLTKERQGLFMR